MDQADALILGAYVVVAALIIGTVIKILPRIGGKK